MSATRLPEHPIPRALLRCLHAQVLPEGKKKPQSSAQVLLPRALLGGSTAFREGLSRWRLAAAVPNSTA